MILGDARFAFLCCSCTRDDDSKLLSDLGCPFRASHFGKPVMSVWGDLTLSTQNACAGAGHINAAAEPGSVAALHALEQLDQSAGVAVLQMS